MKEFNGKEYFSYEETASYLGVSLATIKNMLKDGRLTSIRIGRRSYVPKFILNNFLNLKTEYNDQQNDK